MLRATYGVPETVPISEDHPQRPINPYEFSKLAVERRAELVILPLWSARSIEREQRSAGSRRDPI